MKKILSLLLLSSVALNAQNVLYKSGIPDTDANNANSSTSAVWKNTVMAPDPVSKHFPNYQNWWSIFQTSFSGSGTYQSQLAFGANREDLWLRYKINGWKGWKKVIISDYNGRVGIGSHTNNEAYDLCLSNAKNGAESSRLGFVNTNFLENAVIEYHKSKQLRFQNWLNGGQSVSTFMTIDYPTGRVGIGTMNPDSELTVKGKIHAEEVKIDLTVPADYVFQKYYLGTSALKADYVMLTLEEVEAYTKANHHLPEIPSAEQLKQKGLQVGNMVNKLLQKIEELTLYTIEQQRQLESQDFKIKELEQIILSIKNN